MKRHDNTFIIQEAATPIIAQHVTNKGDVLEFVAVLQEAEEKNRNGRRYPKRVLEDAINSPYVQERLRTKSLFAEAGHPLDNSIQRQMTIDIRNAVCLIKELWFEGNTLKGKCETLNTQLGRDFKGLIEQGVVVGFSLRAQGNVHPDPQGGVVVDSPISVCTWDSVVNPSHSGAFLERICESAYNSYIKPTGYANRSLALTEATNLFDNGMLIETGEIFKETVDYSKNYHKKVKYLSETYIPEEGDKMVSLAEDKRSVILENENIKKKVLLEDFVIKDIRKKIGGLE